jgi:AraC-like DNA-binding protein/mannose-6-phosphate isomerase-like protein (cupin superfamily)
MPLRVPRPHSLQDFRMEGVQYQLMLLQPGESFERQAYVAGYFYHVLSGSITLQTDAGSVVATVRDTITMGGSYAHHVTNTGPGVAEVLVGAEPFEVLSWMRQAPNITVYAANSRHPMLKRLFLAMDLVVEELSNPQITPDQLTLERTAELIIFYFMRMGNAVDGSLDPFPGSDPRLMAVIAAMNAQPLRNWTVGELAAVASMSRSAFADRFMVQVGDTPIRTLTAIRLKAAAREMREGMSMTEVAGRYGYGSVEAFNRAFKRCFNITPGRWLRDKS